MPTTEGVIRPPSAFSTTTGSPASITAATELVVPKSIPNTFAMIVLPLLNLLFCYFDIGFATTT